MITFSVRIDFCAVMMQILYEFCLTQGGFFVCLFVFFIAFPHFSIWIVTSNMGCENFFLVIDPFLCFIWQHHSQLWATLKGTIWLTWCYSLRFTTKFHHQESCNKLESLSPYDPSLVRIFCENQLVRMFHVWVQWPGLTESFKLQVNRLV